MFLERGIGRGGRVWQHFEPCVVEHADHAADNPSGEGTDVDYKKVVSCKIVELIFIMMMQILGDMVKPGRLHPINKVYGINWKANVNTAQSIVKVCNGKYADFSNLVEVDDAYLVTLERVTKIKDDWSDAECIFCLKLLMSGLIWITSCGLMFHHLCWLKHCQVLCMGQTQAPSPMCRTIVMAFCHGFP
jgi:hypothetical protein